MSKILIVEDEPDMVAGLKDNFEFEGYEVATDVDGQAGLDQAGGQVGGARRVFAQVEAFDGSSELSQSDQAGPSSKRRRTRRPTPGRALPVVPRGIRDQHPRAARHGTGEWCGIRARARVLCRSRWGKRVAFVLLERGSKRC